jgi:hypothetical protein
MAQFGIAVSKSEEQRFKDVNFAPSSEGCIPEQLVWFGDTMRQHI